MPERPGVVITGASGLIDTRLPSLIAPDYTVAALDVAESPTRFPAQAELFDCDLTNDASTEQAVFEELFIEPWMIDLADAHYPVSIDRVRERLGWEPRHRLRWMLPEMIERLRADREAWNRENDLPVQYGATGDAGREG